MIAIGCCLVIAAVFNQLLAATVHGILFGLFAASALCGTLLVILQRKPSRSALAFAMVIISVAGIMFLQAAPFLAVSTIIIYAGAIIVTFLFVLMLAQQIGFSSADDQAREPVLATISSFVLATTLIIVARQSFPDLNHLEQLRTTAQRASKATTLIEVKQHLGAVNEFVSAIDREAERLRFSPIGEALRTDADGLQILNSSRVTHADAIRALASFVQTCDNAKASMTGRHLPADNVSAIGRIIYSQHLLAVELAGTLLLVATIGSIIIGRARETG
jgi:NADH:ubiquinone oxidoreductase subunit 6 (subunit J)